MSLTDLLASRAKAVIAYDGVEVARTFGDPEIEWATLDAAVALVDTSYRRTIIVSGTERRSFLHGQISQSVLTLKTGESQPSLLLNAQGRVLAIVAVYEEGETFEIVVEEANLTPTFERLEQFLVADDVEFRIEEARDRFAVVGPDTPRLLAQLGVGLPAEVHSSASGTWFMRAARIAGLDVLLYGRADLRVPAIEVVADDVEPVWRALEAAGAKPAGADAFEIIRIEGGTPRYGVDVDAERLALESRLEWAIHFRKGCYVGQEIVERTVSRGRVPRLLTLLATEKPVHVGDRVADTGEKDVVTSVAVSPRGGPLCLAYVMTELAEPGKKLTVRGVAGEVAARVLAWPRTQVYPGR